MDKATVLDRLFERTVSRVSEPGMLDQIGPDQHTGKDIIAHLAAWKQRLVRWFKIASQGEIPLAYFLTFLF